MKGAFLAETVVRIYLQSVNPILQPSDFNGKGRVGIVMGSHFLSVYADSRGVAHALEYQTHISFRLKFLCKYSDAPVRGKIRQTFPAAGYRNRINLSRKLAVTGRKPPQAVAEFRYFSDFVCFKCSNHI